jgi:Flp pilus assembly protein TadG
MYINRMERGQAIVLIVFSIFLLVVMSALIIDGGNAFLNRRVAQTAADAAVLAAANAKCVHQATDAELDQIVNDYAVTENHADFATWSYTPPDADNPKGKLTVETQIDGDTFFARVFNQPIVTVRADASAGCYLPAAANNLLPIAWTCRQREGGTTGQCVINQVPHSDWDDIVTSKGEDWFSQAPVDPLIEPLHILDAGITGDIGSYTDQTGGPVLYLVMDEPSFEVETYCEEYGGAINCDFNDDGILDVEGGADRGWLLLDGQGAVDLSNLMLYGYDQEIVLPQWFPGKSGVANSVFINAHEIKFRINVIPVFNSICESTTYLTLTSDCPTEYIAGDLIRESSGDWSYYRVPGIAAFVVTCVSKGVSEYCPGKELTGMYEDANLKKTSTIEGYFIGGYNFGTAVGSGGFDLGVYVLSLVD